MELGKYNSLRVARYTSVGLFLEEEGNEDEAVLLPMKWVPKNVSEGDELEVFIYLDNEERPIATTMKPKATVGDFAYLKVKDVSEVGAFLDWGLEKDLFVPFKEQHERMEAGRSYVVYIYVDEKTDRIAASSKVEKYADKDISGLEASEEMELLIAGKTDLGYKAIINNRQLGLIYENEIFENIETGDRTKGYVKTIRDDGKVDLALQKSGYSNVEPNAAKILKSLRENEGFLPLHDKSDPQEISQNLGISKKIFKKAIGSLYRQKLITIDEDGVRLV